MLKGLYKVEFETARRKSVGVIYADGGRLRGGNSAFCYIGTYTEDGSAISGTVKSKRHTADPSLPAVFGFDSVNIAFEGTAKDDYAICEGTAAEAPSLKFKALLTRVDD